MLRSFRGVLCAAMVFIVYAPALADDTHYQWKEVLNKNGIQVFSGIAPGSPYRAAKAQMTIKGSISSLVAMLEDIKNCSNWASLCKEVAVIERLPNNESILYILNEVTFPVADRELVAHISWAYDASSGRVTMSSEAIGYPKIPVRPSTVRLRNALTQWHFTPKPNGKVLVESFAHIDPNGPIPAWIVNMLSKRAPYRSMEKIKEIIESGQYSGKNTVFTIPR
ncbi:MAG: START domain-containing protein [Arenicella sp.]